jgi:tRNA G18 (ribose-2'-O)-methylase SpoU
MALAVPSFQHHKPAGESQPKRRIIALLDNIRSAYNVGAIFRTADGIGTGHIYLCGITPNPGENDAIQKTALGAEIEVPWSHHLDALGLGRALQSQGYRLVALETTPDSQLVFEFNLQKSAPQPILLVVGNEQAGVDPGLLNLCDHVFAVPMVGSKASLNVAVAFGIAAYWLAFS